MVSVEVKVTKEITKEQLLGQPLKDFWNTVMLLAHSDVAKAGRVPIDTGNLRNTLAPGGGVTSIDSAAVPMFAVVGTNASYATYLETSPKYHYRSGPSQGNETAGWLSSTVQNVQPDIEGALSELAADIEAQWYG